jgi:hypothetical protein
LFHIYISWFWIVRVPVCREGEAVANRGEIDTQTQGVNAFPREVAGADGLVVWLKLCRPRRVPAPFA